MKQFYLFITLLFITSSSYSNTNLPELDCDLVVSTPISNTAYICDESVTLSVAATGSTLTYQWYFNFLPIIDGTANTILATVPGFYDCVITSELNELCSEYVNFTVLATTPIIINEPTSTTLCQGEQLFLSVFATGENLTYQWFLNDLPIIGADSMYLTINTVTQADAGDYYCRVSSGCSVNSQVAIVAVNNPIITDNPASSLGCKGDPHILSVEAEGQMLEYQVFFNGSAIPGANSNTYQTIIDEDTIGDYFWVVSSQNCPSIVSSMATIFMAPIATIEAEANQSFTAGQTLTDLEVSGSQIKWSSTEQINFQDLLPSTTPLVDGTTYYAFAEGTGFECRSDVVAITAHLDLGTNDLNKVAFHYYPNPVKEVIHFKSESYINTIQLYTIVGQVVLQKYIHSQSGSLDTDRLPQGQYILKVNTIEGEQNFKILKE